jgi:ribonucleoside-diphosphate reductase alpha chain
MRVLKRDNKTVEQFHLAEIRKALLMSFSAVGNVPDTSPIERAITRRLHGLVKDIVTVDDILDAVEHELMDSGYLNVAKRFILYREQRNQDRAARLVPDPLAISDYTHVAKYARYQKRLRRRETYLETVTRVKQMHKEKFAYLGEDFAKRIDTSFDAVYRKAVLPSMRSMQFGGLAIEKTNARLYNCCFTHVSAIDSFSKIFYLLLCGCGVGYSVQYRHVEKLPILKTIDRRKVEHHIIEDSIEGWGDAVNALMKAFFESGVWVEFAYYKIRDEGAELVTSGGKAPGHIPLREGLEAVRSILLRAQGRSLTPIECHDMLCFLSLAVLSGGIRRSAMIALFSPEDGEMVYSKAKSNYDVVKGINNQRQMANNSAIFLRNTMSEDELFRRIIKVADENWGDPGFLFVNNLDHGTNPCGEIGLDPVLDGAVAVGFAFCNLTSINCAMFETPNDFYKAAEHAAFIGTLQASYTDFPYLGQVTEAIARRDALLGVSLNGMMDCPIISADPKNQRIAAAVVNRINAEVAGLIGIKAAARTTAVKPEGTSSLELGCIGSGAHEHHAPRYLRRVTGNINEPPVIEFMRVNPHMIEHKPNGDVALVFPVQTRAGAKCLGDTTALEFVEMVMSTYENWVKTGTVRGELTHSVSCTVTLREGEREGVIDYIWENRHRIAAMTFVPYSLDKLYPFAPREAITTPEDETYWNRLISGYRPIDWANFFEEEDMTKLTEVPACSGPVCEIA